LDAVSCQSTNISAAWPFVSGSGVRPSGKGGGRRRIGKKFDAEDVT
jgi:hypothetical protein